MGVESAADRAVFTNPDEFGTLIRYQFGNDPPITVAANWYRPIGEGGFGNAEVYLDAHRFLIDCPDLPAPRNGAVITVLATLEIFDVVREPKLSEAGTQWTLTAAAA